MSHSTNNENEMEEDYCLGCETGIDNDDAHRDPVTNEYYKNCCCVPTDEETKAMDDWWAAEMTTDDSKLSNPSKSYPIHRGYVRIEHGKRKHRKKGNRQEMINAAHVVLKHINNNKSTVQSPDENKFE